MNGDYCCKYNQEKAGGGYPSEISSGTCDGIGFNRESTCCKDNAYQSCQTKGCFDYQGNINPIRAGPGHKVPGRHLIAWHDKIRGLES